MKSRHKKPIVDDPEEGYQHPGPKENPAEVLDHYLTEELADRLWTRVVPKPSWCRPKVGEIA